VEERHPESKGILPALDKQQKKKGNIWRRDDKAEWVGTQVMEQQRTGVLADIPAAQWNGKEGGVKLFGWRTKKTVDIGEVSGQNKAALAEGGGKTAAKGYGKSSICPNSGACGRPGRDMGPEHLVFAVGRREWEGKKGETNLG